MSTNTDRIREKLDDVFRAGSMQKLSTVTVISGDLHESVGFIPGSHPNQMPSVCNIMWEYRKASDEVLHETPSGRSSTLKIRYKLPR